jgi:hypothetical protein
MASKQVELTIQNGTLVSAQLLRLVGNTIVPTNNWLCSNNIPETSCAGITVIRTEGKATFANVVLTDIVNKIPPITLNGTLTFTPF